MTRMSLTTFLFNDCVDSVERTTRLAKYADDPGGGDYHWAAKQAASKLFYEDMPYDRAVAEVMSNMTRPYQRKDNQEALKTIYEWKRVNPGIAYAPPAGEIIGPKGELIVVLKPAFALKQKGIITAYVPWMFKDERLTANIAGIGVHLLELGLKRDAREEWRFALIDTVTGKCFVRTHKNTAEAALFMIRTQEELLLEQKKRKAA
jgi:hypothetical protein